MTNPLRANQHDEYESSAGNVVRFPSSVVQFPSNLIINGQTRSPSGSWLRDAAGTLSNTDILTSDYQLFSVNVSSSWPNVKDVHTRIVNAKTTVGEEMTTPTREEIDAKLETVDAKLAAAEARTQTNFKELSGRVGAHAGLCVPMLCSSRAITLIYLANY
jgi:hypothetical protein